MSRAHRAKKRAAHRANATARAAASLLTRASFEAREQRMRGLAIQLNPYHGLHLDLSANPSTAATILIDPSAPAVLEAGCECACCQRHACDCQTWVDQGEPACICTFCQAVLAGAPVLTEPAGSAGATEELPAGRTLSRELCEAAWETLEAVGHIEGGRILHLNTAGPGSAPAAPPPAAPEGVDEAAWNQGAMPKAPDDYLEG